MRAAFATSHRNNGDFCLPSRYFKHIVSVVVTYDYYFLSFCCKRVQKMSDTRKNKGRAGAASAKETVAQRLEQRKEARALTREEKLRVANAHKERVRMFI